jgi:serine acetyltransferase
MADSSLRFWGTIEPDFNTFLNDWWSGTLFRDHAFMKEYRALQAYCLGYWLWTGGGKTMVACFIQNRKSEGFAVDISPAAFISKGICHHYCDW